MYSRKILFIIVLTYSVQVGLSWSETKQFIYQLSKASNTFDRYEEMAIIKRKHNDIEFVMITGPEGKGKTDLALKYAEYFKEAGGNVIWIDCSSMLGMIHHIYKLAEVLGINSYKRKVENIMTDVSDHFKVRRTLLVFDGVKTNNYFIHQLESYLVRRENIKVLLTSRTTNWPRSTFNMMRLADLSTEKVRKILYS